MLKTQICVTRPQCVKMDNLHHQYDFINLIQMWTDEFYNYFQTSKRGIMRHNCAAFHCHFHSVCIMSELLVGRPTTCDVISFGFKVIFIFPPPSPPTNSRSRLCSHPSLVFEGLWGALPQEVKRLGQEDKECVEVILISLHILSRHAKGQFHLDLVRLWIDFTTRRGLQL